MSFLSHVISHTKGSATPTHPHRISASVSAYIQIFPRESMASFADCFFGVGDSSFCRTILHVFGLSSWDYMLWIKARRIVADMTNYFLRWQWYRVPDECSQPVQPNLLAVDSKHSISIGILSSTPNPAPSSKVNYHVAHIRSLHQKFTQCNWKVVR